MIDLELQQSHGHRTFLFQDTSKMMFSADSWYAALKKLADGFSVLSAKRIFHNDVKNNNILLTYKNG